MANKKKKDNKKRKYSGPKKIFSIRSLEEIVSSVEQKRESGESVSSFKLVPIERTAHRQIWHLSWVPFLWHETGESGYEVYFGADRKTKDKSACQYSLREDGSADELIVQDIV